MKRLTSLLTFVPLIIGGIFVVSGLANIAQAAQNVRIQVATQYAKDHPTTAALYEFKDRIEKETDGRIKIRVFPANQL
jgi:TRAP-type C4-dicarboxylate transport system substrate-binding protein